MFKKILFISTLFLLFHSCKTYLEYTEGTSELNYSFNSKIKRHGNIEKALKKAESVIFLDINLSTEKNPKMVLKTLNSNIEKFKSLKKLTILSNGIDLDYFPENIFNCKKLEFLVLQRFKNLKPAVINSISKLENLVFLGLPASNIKEIPNSVLKLKQLEGLDLATNGISEIPKEISNLENIKTIDLTNNCLTSFPSELSSCNKLEHLDLNNAEGKDTKQLIKLGCCYNKMTNFDSLSEFKKLKSLSLFMVISNEEKQRLKVHYPTINIH